YHPLRADLLHEGRELVLDAVDGQVEVGGVEFQHREGMLPVGGDIPPFLLHVAQDPVLPFFEADVDDILPFLEAFPYELQGKGGLPRSIRADDGTDAPRDEAPAHHLVKALDPDLHPTLAHMTTRMLLTSNPSAEVIRTANFTRSFSSRWGINPRNFSMYITRCRLA